MGLLTAPRPKGMLLMAPDRTEEAEVLFLPSTLPQHHLFLAALEHDPGVAKKSTSFICAQTTLGRFQVPKVKKK